MLPGISPGKSLGRVILLALTLPLLGSAQDEAKPGDRKRQRLKDNAADFWIYDDLDEGYARAKTSGKPLLVSFRCVP